MKKFLIKSLYYYHKIFKPGFYFNGKKYTYFAERKDKMTWRNERAVELPLMWSEVQKFKGKRILEIGNVLSHYFSFEHDIVDKFEKGKGVINQDVVDFKPKKKYDLIVSISTLEHVGCGRFKDWDEFPKEPKKVLRAVENLKNNCLAEGGKMIVSMPVNYNVDMDKMIEKNEIPFTEKFWLKRISWLNDWKEADWNSVKDAEFDSPYSFANALLIGIIRK
ncbi:MAG: hypothetical protein ABH986_01640 [archaeon]